MPHRILHGALCCLTIAIALCCPTAAAARSLAPADSAQSQTVCIYGRVYDSFTKAALPARVQLLTPDSAVIDTTTARRINNNSVAQSLYSLSRVPARSADYILHFRLEGYEDTCVSFRLHHYRRKTDYPASEVLMKRKSQEDIYKEVGLNEVVVKGTKVKIAYRGDTVVYNASAFSLPEGSMLDALVRQLPGAELRSNGDIYVNGEKIDYLMLNGKELFKGKNNVVLDNLPYFIVDNVAVYHHTTERDRWLGKMEEPKDFVMDLKLKREYNRGIIVNGEAGVGSHSRYLARAFGLLYDDLYRVSIYGEYQQHQRDALARR